MTPLILATHALALCAGIGISEAARRFLRRTPRCTALLRSGEGCLCALGHAGPHRTRIDVDGSGIVYQGYVWEDPSSGLHTAGFFHSKIVRK